MTTSCLPEEEPQKQVCFLGVSRHNACGVGSGVGGEGGGGEGGGDGGGGCVEREGHKRLQLLVGVDST